jgi:hypothetical protein
LSEVSQQQEKMVLPFSPEKQEAVLGYLLRDEKFFKTCRHKIQHEWFVDGMAGRVWKARLKFEDTFEHAPKAKPDFVQWGDFITEDPQTRSAMRTKVNVCFERTNNFSLDVIQQELQGWYQAVLFKDAAQKAAHLFNNKKFEECYLLMAEEMTRIRAARFVEDNEYDFDNLEALAAQEEHDRDHACTLGYHLLDRCLLPDAPSGSLLPGDQTIVLGSTNAGKTRTMVTTIKHNIVRKKYILWMMHEGRENDLALLLWCSLLKCTRLELFERMKTVEGKRKIDAARKLISEYVTFVPYQKAGMTVEDVAVVIRNKCEEFAAKHQGKMYDLFVDDYPAKLTTKQAQGGHMAMRHVMDIVYNYFVNLAGEYKFHSFVGFQTNRVGAKVQRGQSDDSRLLTKEDASEAYGPMMTATNVITLNRPEDLKARGYVIWHFDKSRSGETGWSVCVKSDYARCITHSKELGGVRYRGNSTMAEQMDSYMTSYGDGTVPEEVVATG